MGSASPNNVFAREALIKTVDGSDKTLILPFSVLQENIAGKFDSTHIPVAIIFFSPTVSTWPKFHEAIEIYLKSLPYLVRNSSPIGIQTAWPVPIFPSSPVNVVITWPSCPWLLYYLS